MGATFHFIASPSEPSEVLRWFQNLDAAPERVETKSGAWLLFRESGLLAHNVDGSINPEKSPLVSVTVPRVRRDILWTVGEVQFCPAPLRAQFPKLQKIQANFSAWLSSHERIFSNKARDGVFDYYLEGMVRNYATEIFAFESGLSAIKGERYFVTNHETEGSLDVLSKKLSLRGVNCAAA